MVDGRRVREATVFTRSLFLSVVAHGALVVAFASVDVVPARLPVAGGAGPGDDGLVVQIRLVPPRPPEPVVKSPPMPLPLEPVVEIPPTTQEEPAIETDLAPREEPAVKTESGPDRAPQRPREPEDSDPAEAVAPLVEAVEAEEDPSPSTEEPAEPVSRSEPSAIAGRLPEENHVEDPPPAPPRPVDEARPETLAQASGGAGVEAPQVENPLALRPRYPLRCRRLGHEGVTVIAIEIRADGRVGAVSVARSAGCPELDRAALDAVRRARFRPARVRGRPVPAAIEQEFRFRLRD